MICIQNSTLVMADHYIRNGTLICNGNTIIYCGKHTDTPAGAKVINGEGLFTGPGLIDIHLHAGNKTKFIHECEMPSRFHLERGTTSLMPALYFTLSKEEAVDRIHYLQSYLNSEKTPNLRGIYFEGPYMNPEFGASKRDIKWAGEIRREDYMPVLEAAGQDVHVWGLAPEREHIEQFCIDAKRINPNCVFSTAHCACTPEQVERLLPLGLRLATHHTNATGSMPHFPECRSCGVDEAVNYYDQIYAEIISDEYGIHVPPFLQRLIRRIKGRDRLILITDQGYHEGPPIPGLEHVTDINFDLDGEIAATKLTLNEACRNYITHTGASICDAFYAASHNPAKLLGWETKGQIREGGDADIILVDYDMNVKKVICNGKIEK